MADSNDESYKKLITGLNLNSLSYKDIAEDWEERNEEWYHALIAIEDLPAVLVIPNFKIYAWCRRKLIADDKSEGHFHWHGLVHFKIGKLESWRRQQGRLGIGFSSVKNTFRKVECLDHVVGILRYISCKDGQKTGRRDGDGLATHPHTHYARQPIDESHRHARGTKCSTVRDQISCVLAGLIDLAEKLNWTVTELHDREICLCDRGTIGKQKKLLANEKRRSYYKTDAGIQTKQKYQEKAKVKRQILNHLAMMKVNKKAKLCHETIENLMKLL